MPDTAIPPDAIAAYKATDFCVDGDMPFILHIGEPCAALAALFAKENYASCAFISPCNPFGETADSNQNDARQAAFGRMLEARGWRGHFFVTTGRVGAPTFLSPEQVRELNERGHVVGSHSETHPPRMSHCSPEELLGEWRRSVAFLSEPLGEEVVTASVPGGFYSRAVAEAAARAGVRRLFTSEPTERVEEVEGCLVFGRYGVQRWTTPEAVAGIVKGDFLPRRRQQLAWSAKKLTKRVGGEYYLRARRALIGRG